MSIKKGHKKTDIEKSIDLLLDICSLLMCSGANTKRVIDSVNRFAEALHLKPHALISHKSIIMTLTDIETKHTYTVVTQIPKYKINFLTVADISRASWKAIDRKWNFEQIEKRITDIRNKKRYPIWLVLFAVSLAGASFARIFGGDYFNMIVAFIATLAGLLMFKIAHNYHINAYVRTYLSSVVASFVAGLGILSHIGVKPDIALATSVLFLVPGVPLVNSFNDFYNNHILNGMVRFISGFITVLAIGLGVISIMLILNINVFK